MVLGARLCIVFLTISCGLGYLWLSNLAPTTLFYLTGFYNAVTVAAAIQPMVFPKKIGLADSTFIPSRIKVEWAKIFVARTDTGSFRLRPGTKKGSNLNRALIF